RRIRDGEARRAGVAAAQDALRRDPERDRAARLRPRADPGLPADAAWPDLHRALAPAITPRIAAPALLLAAVSPASGARKKQKSRRTEDQEACLQALRSRSRQWRKQEVSRLVTARRFGGAA